ncbi:MAG: hypothetical protein AB8F78_17730 [Saprospiraceae bacterium]
MASDIEADTKERISCVMPTVLLLLKYQYDSYYNRIYLHSNPFKVMNYLLTILFTILTVSVSFGQSDTLNTQSVEQADVQVLSKIDFDINFPSDWTLDEQGQMGTSFIILSPQTDEADKFRENVNLMIQDLAGYQIDLDKFSEISEEQIKTLINDGKIISSEKVSNAIPEYQKVEYTGTQGILSLHFVQHYWVHNEKAYILTLTCEADQFVNYEEIGKGVLSSFVLK